MFWNSIAEILAYGQLQIWQNITVSLNFSQIFFFDIIWAIFNQNVWNQHYEPIEDDLILL